jgi:(+)-trans-carveol dehydrogenase/(-)-trans-carveol dehydrogenase
MRAAVPQMVERGEGGSLIATSSCAGLRGMAYVGHYSAAKHAVIGLMKSLACELGEHGIRANAVCPYTVNTQMVNNEWGYRTTSPDNPTEEGLKEVTQAMHLLPTPWMEPEDITAVYMLLASDEGRYITGQAIAVDAGFLSR